MMSGCGKKRRGGWVGFSLLLAVGLLFGCVTTDKGKEKAKKTGDAETVLAFQPPRPGKGVGLKRRWRTSVAGSANRYLQHPGQLAVSGNSLFVGTFQGGVYRLDARNGRVVWKTHAGAAVSGGVAVDDERVFAGTRGGEMVAFSRKDGRGLWRVRVSTTVASAPRVAAGKVLFLTLDNRTYALNTEDGKRLWVHSTLPEPLVVMGAATPSVDEDRVYVGYSSGEVFSLALKDGRPQWSQNLSHVGGRSEIDRLQDVDAAVVVPTEDDFTGSLRKIFTVNHQGNAVAMYPPTGARIWDYAVSAVRKPLLIGDRLVISGLDGSLVAISADDGVVLWRVRVTDGLLTAPVRMGGRILVADDKGHLFAVDPTGGKVMGLDTIGDPVLADPVVVGKTLFLWTNDGNLIRMDS